MVINIMDKYMNYNKSKLEQDKGYFSLLMVIFVMVTGRMIFCMAMPLIYFIIRLVMKESSIRDADKVMEY